MTSVFVPSSLAAAPRVLPPRFCVHAQLAAEPAPIDHLAPARLGLAVAAAAVLPLWRPRKTRRRAGTNGIAIGCAGRVEAAAATCRSAASATAQVSAPPVAEKLGNSYLANEWFSRRLASRRDSFDLQLAEDGAAAVARLPAPARNQEAWRYTDLEALLYKEHILPSVNGKPSEAELAELLEVEAPKTSVQSPASSSTSPGRFGEARSASEFSSRARLVFVDGVLLPSMSDQVASGSESHSSFVAGGQLLRSGEYSKRTLELLAALPEVNAFPEASLPREALGCAKMAAMNQASFKDCGCLTLLEPSEDQGECDKPLLVEVVFFSTGSSDSAPRLIVDVGRFRTLHLVETHLSLGDRDESLSNGLCRVLLGKGCKVTHDLLQQKSGNSRHIESVVAELSTDAVYNIRIVQTGCLAARVNVAVSFRGEGSSCDIRGAMLSSGKQQLDLHSLISHGVPGCKSSHWQKNIAAETSECIFKGSIKVAKEGQITHSEQICRSLLLSDKARVKVMPSLQIRADDVSCSHGAAVTEVNEDEAFYLRSRGLSRQEAQTLLLQAFPQDLLVGLEGLVPKAHARIQAKLAALAETARKI